VRYRPLGNTGMAVSEIGFGTWAFGGDWGDVDERAGVAGLRRAIEAGVNLFDTADVYGHGRSEEVLGRTVASQDDILIATKVGRPEFEDPATYSRVSMRRRCDASLKRLRREVIDVYQLHTPSTEVLAAEEAWESLRRLRDEGKVRAFGASVESAEQGRIAIERGAQTLQIIFNVFRQSVIDELFPLARERQVGVLARIPLASGLLTGKLTRDSVFSHDDHRSFNREGKAFNVGETFAGLPFEAGVALVQELRWIAEGRGSMARAAVRFVLDHDEVSSVIPGFRNADQVEENLSGAEVAPFSEAERARLLAFFRERARPLLRGPV
jgi:aryl-alcohol dehydrogenase-like predicted oxidoreductase